METISELDRSFYPTVITPSNDVVSINASQLQSLFRDHIAKAEEGDVLLDLSAVKMIDSMGVSLVVGLVKELRKQNRDLHILGTRSCCARVSNYAARSPVHLLPHRHRIVYRLASLISHLGSH